MKRRLLLTTVLMLGIGACGQGADGAAEGGEAQPADTLTTQQRDSAMAELPIPGIGGIGAARRAAEAAEKRAEAHDTIH